MRPSKHSPTIVVRALPVQAEPDEEVLKEVVEVPFSGEEVGGRYLDLHTHYHVFVNAKFGAQLDYVEYLTSFAKLEGVPRAQRLTKPYRWRLPTQCHLQTLAHTAAACARALQAPAATVPALAARSWLLPQSAFCTRMHACMPHPSCWHG